MAAASVIIAVVGPSGAGKDSLIDYVRPKLASDRRFVFVQRHITRPAEAGGERHVAVSEEQFLQLEYQGAFAVTWQAHGLHYGVPSWTQERLAETRPCCLIINGSRSALPMFQHAYDAALRVVRITADLNVLARRLADRGRESREEIALRLARSQSLGVLPEADITITNNGKLAEAGEKLLAYFHLQLMDEAKARLVEASAQKQS